MNYEAAMNLVRMMTGIGVGVRIFPRSEGKRGAEFDPDEAMWVVEVGLYRADADQIRRVVEIVATNELQSELTNDWLEVS